MILVLSSKSDKKGPKSTVQKTTYMCHSGPVLFEKTIGKSQKMVKTKTVQKIIYMCHSGPKG